jgi:hypothetical protein
MSSDDTHPNTIAVNEMVKEIAKKTNGAVNIKVFSNNVLGSPPETTEQARLGVIEFAVLSPSQLDKFNRAFGVVMIPYQFDDYAHAYKTLDETAWDWFQAKAHDIGFEIVANFEWGFRALSNPGRRQGHEAQGAAGNPDQGFDGGLGSNHSDDRLPRGLHGAGEQGCRRPGQPDPDRLFAEVFRGAEQHRADQARL